MPDLVKRITDDDGEDCNDPAWHLMDFGCSGDEMVLCTGEPLDAFSDLIVEHKTTKRGGITCKKCLKTVKAYKAVKI